MRYVNGDHVVWVGSKGLFETPVVIRKAWQVDFVTMPNYSGNGAWVYDIADPKTGATVLFAAREEQLLPCPHEAGDDRGRCAHCGTPLQEARPPTNGTARKDRA